MIFVLVHGIMDTCRKFKVMQAAFEDQGHRCIVPTLKPRSGSKGLEHLAKQLEHIVDAATQGEQNIRLVGFSMGGLVCRYYLHELGGYQRVSQFFSIAAPHHGTLWAYLMPNFSWSNRGVCQMRPNSDFLRTLEQNHEQFAGIACYSYWTPFDLIILPARSSVWDKAENIEINALCHPMMVSDKLVIADILAKATELR
jgi:triacylglycerol lipase